MRFPSQLWPFGAVLIGFFAVILLTGPHSYSDTNMYAAEIQQAGSVSDASLWDFGHLLWRPAGWLAYRATAAWLEPRIGASYFVVFPPLIAVNLAAGLACVLLAFVIGRSASGRVGAGLAVSAGLLASSAFLNMTQTGTAYVPGLALQLGGMAVIISAVKSERLSWAAAGLAGVLLAASCAVWVAYVLALPAAGLTVLVWDRNSLSFHSEQGRRRLLFLGRLTAVTFVTGAIVFGLGAAVVGISSAAEARAWLSDAGHGYAQTRNWLRIGAGIPRALLDLGNDGMTIKRYFFGDPYAQTTLLDVVEASLWKIALVHAMLALSVWGLAATAAGRRLLLPLAASAAAVLAFALGYEAGSAERYLPIYPILIVVVGFLCRDFSWRRPTRAGLAVLLAAMVCVNLPSFALVTARQQFDGDIRRIETARQRLRPASRVVLLSFRDGIHDFYHRFPFHPLALEGQLPVYYLTDPMEARADLWPQHAAQAMLRAWEQGGDVWVSRRLFAEKPLPEWGWVEKDNPDLLWRDVAAFFGRLDAGETIGGDDGFVRLLPDEKNMELLREFAQGLEAGDRPLGSPQAADAI
jgi:hypothetical protein